MTSPATIRQADAQRMLIAVRKAGFYPTRIRMKPGEIDIIFDGDGKPAVIDPNPWDEPNKL